MYEGACVCRKRQDRKNCSRQESQCIAGRGLNAFDATASHCNPRLTVSADEEARHRSQMHTVSHPVAQPLCEEGADIRRLEMRQDARAPAGNLARLPVRVLSMFMLVSLVHLVRPSALVVCSGWLTDLQAVPAFQNSHAIYFSFNIQTRITILASANSSCSH